jgi:putative transposase
MLMKSIRALRFNYDAGEKVHSLLESFRRMCNDAIHIALSQKPKSRFQLINQSYVRLKEYGLHTHYILSACEVAYSVYRNKSRKSCPYVKKPFLKLDNQAYKLDYLLLRIPTAPRNFIHLSLNGSAYHRTFLAEKSLKFGSIMINEKSIVITFSKDVAQFAPWGRIGIDVNERNATWSDTVGNSEPEDLSRISEIKERYKWIRGKIAQRTQKDMRVQRRLLSRYGERERNRCVQAVHRVSKSIVKHAKENHLGIVMEKLTGIRKLYRKGNGQGTSFRGRMNSWMFREMQRQIEYKATWEGIPVVYVSSRGTSRYCPDCGSLVVPLQERRLYCVRCDRVWDRDELASKNIMMAASLVRAARPPACGCEGEPRRREKAGNPRSRRVEGESLG